MERRRRRRTGPRPYTLLLTYGFSQIVSPEPFRDGLGHEYSLAVPAGTPLSPWADAFLRHQCRYILTQGADIRVDDCVPLRGVAMTRIPFQPQHHASMPDSSLVGILAAKDPVLDPIATPAGPVEVRPLVGIARFDPLLLSTLTRPSLMSDPAFRAEVDRRAAAQGSSVDAALFDIAWDGDDDGVHIEIPFGAAAKRLVDGIHGRLGFGRRLIAVSPRSQPIEFLPGEPAIEVTPRGLRLVGGIDDGPVADVLEAARAAVSAGESRWLSFS